MIGGLRRRRCISHSAAPIQFLLSVIRLISGAKEGICNGLFYTTRTSRSVAARFVMNRTSATRSSSATSAAASASSGAASSTPRSRAQLPAQIDVVVVLQELFILAIVFLLLFAVVRSWCGRPKRTLRRGAAMGALAAGLPRSRPRRSAEAPLSGGGSRDAGKLGGGATTTLVLIAALSIVLLAGAHVALALWHVRFHETLADRAMRTRHAHLASVLQRRISVLENASRVERNARFTMLSEHVRRSQRVFLNQSKKLTRMVRRKEAWSDALDANVTKMAEPLRVAASTMLLRMNHTDERVAASLHRFQSRLYAIEGQLVEIVAAQRDVEDRLQAERAASAAAAPVVARGGGGGGGGARAPGPQPLVQRLLRTVTSRK